MLSLDKGSETYRLKVTVVALASILAGIGALALNTAIQQRPSLHWLAWLPVGEVGAVLLTTGLFGIVWDYFDGRDREQREDERIRRLLIESAPAMRDAVVAGFAVSPEDLARVATPELLDHIASNALALRLGDPTFAAEVYAEIRDQAIRARERWTDVDVKIRLSSIDERSTAGAPRFAVLVTWEYTVIPTSTIRRFACTSDRDEFHELVSDMPVTSTWFMTPRPGFVAREKQSFELLQFSVDGEDRPIRRSERKTGQTYTVSLGRDAALEGTPVRIRHTYRTVTAKSGHRLYIAIAQPAKDLSLSLDYTATDIAALSVNDLVSSSQKPRVSRLPHDASGNEVTIDVPGWLLPQAEVTFVWTLEHELPQSTRTDAPEATTLAA